MTKLNTLPPPPIRTYHYTAPLLHLCVYTVPLHYPTPPPMCIYCTTTLPHSSTYVYILYHYTTPLLHLCVYTVPLHCPTPPPMCIYCTTTLPHSSTYVYILYHYTTPLLHLCVYTVPLHCPTPPPMCIYCTTTLPHSSTYVYILYHYTAPLLHLCVYTVPLHCPTPPPMCIYCTTTLPHSSTYVYILYHYTAPLLHLCVYTVPLHYPTPPPMCIYCTTTLPHSSTYVYILYHYTTPLLHLCVYTVPLHCPTPPPMCIYCTTTLPHSSTYVYILYHYTTPLLHLCVYTVPLHYPTPPPPYLITPSLSHLTLCLLPTPTFHCLLACRTAATCSARDKRLVDQAGEGDGRAESPPDPTGEQPLLPAFKHPSFYWDRAHHHSGPADIQEGTGPAGTAACCTADHCGPKGVSPHVLYRTYSTGMHALYVRTVCMSCMHTPGHEHLCALYGWTCVNVLQELLSISFVDTVHASRECMRDVVFCTLDLHQLPLSIRQVVY